MPLFNINHGLISSKQANRMRYYTNLLIDCSKWKKVYSKVANKYFRFKVNLITLTLPSQQLHSDKEIHIKVFKEFIAAWKRISPELLYIYKAEVQDNGNLHYHLTTNTYINHKSLRNMWNYYVNKLGYTDRCSVVDPNSTDVHSVKNIKDLAAYMVAYMSKKDLYSKKLKRYHRRYDKKHLKTKEPYCVIPSKYFDNIKRKVEIKLWDCSKTLMLGKCSIEIDSDMLMGEIRHSLSISDKLIKKDWCVIVPQSKEERKRYKEISNMYRNHLAKLIDHTKGQSLIYEM